MLKPWLSPPPPAYDPYRPWLTYPGSLTRRIVSRSRRFRVERRFQGARLPSRDEARMLGLRDGQFAHVREVILFADETPVVFAHSVTAMRDIKGSWRGVGKLGSRPLAAALFANPRVRRFPLEYRQISRRHHLHARVRSASLSPPPALWARRSLFQLRGRPLLVTEVFLPAILRLPHQAE
ncbi:MAG TPA: chorismate lyase [Burkholderiales bacterium]|nr:chorismate lyase [Burkholderiales bacterium]